MSGSEKYDEMSAAEVTAEVEKRGLEVTKGSGAGGRVVTADRVAALVKDDAAQARAEAKEEKAEAAAEKEAVEDEAGDAPEPMDEVEEEPVAKAKGAKSNGVIEPTVKAEGVKVGDVVSYRDKFNGSTQDARVSGIVDADEGVVDLAVFSAGGASRRAAVPRGPRSGHWMPKDAA